MTKQIAQLLAFFSLMMLGSTALAEAFDHSHSRYAQILAKQVKDSRVDYAGLKKNPAELDAYLKEIAAVRPDDFKKWTKNQRLALLINLYNAHTFKLIINHYPVKSIRKIGFLPLAAWKIQDVRFGGKLITLDYLENEIIRADYTEPRIHFALVCAANGCPPLCGEPFVADRLNDQLNEQTREFMSESKKNRFDAKEKILWLSPIFKWYKEDFGKLETYAALYLPKPASTALRQADGVKIKYTDYDWNLNEWKK